MPSVDRMTGIVHIARAAPRFIEDRDPGDEHVYPRLRDMTKCPECGAPCEPEPSDAERERLLSDPDFNWYPPDGMYLQFGFGLAGGGFGTYACCERCDFFHKEQSDDE